MITTPRLYLRAFKDDDGDALYQYLSKPEVVLYEPYDSYTREEAILEAKERAKDSRFYAVCLCDTHQLIGNLYFAPVDSLEKMTYSVGYVFHPDYQKQGYAYEACHGLLHHAFSLMNIDKVVAHCNQKNIRSWHLLERLGFTREKELHKNIYFKFDHQGNPIWVDSYQYGILKEEFEKN